MRKIILTRDITLNIETPIPGETGQVIIKQDSVGFHQVVLPAGYFGDISIVQEPNKSTLLEYMVDDQNIYFVSKVLTPPDTVLEPGAILDLTWNYLDAQNVQITFTAPPGNGALKADKYLIYYSNAPITAGMPLAWLQSYEHNHLPSEPGILEVLNLSKLSSSQLYYFTIVAQKTTFGKTHSGPISNIISFTTIALEGGGSTGTADILIPVKKENVTSYYVLFDEDPQTGVSLNTDWLVDYGNIQLHGGLPVGKSANPMRLVHTNQYKTDYMNQIQTIIFDLEDLFVVSKIGIYVEAGSDDRFVYTSTDGTNYAIAATIPSTTAKNQWAVIDLDTNVNIDVRYVKITSTDFHSQWSGIVFIGRRQAAQAIKGQKYKNTLAVLTLPDVVGSNANVAESQDFIKKVANTIRMYANAVWFMTNAPKNLQGGAQSGLITLANVTYRFASAFNGGLDHDVYMLGLKSRNIDVVWSNVGGLLFLHNIDVGDGDAKRRNPLDYGVAYTLENSTNPMNYRFFAQYYWQLAARYGYTGGQPDSLFRIDGTDIIKKGMGCVKYWELGLNECTSSEPDDHAHMNPEQFAALMSACYDGHMGAMGPGFGVKDADPTAICSMAGATGVTIGYKLAMFRWWDAHRGVGNYPISSMNEHLYNVAGGPLKWENTYGLLGLYSLPPEMGGYIDYVKSHVSVRNRNPLLQNTQMWITEQGYDEHYGSPMSPSAPTLAERGLKKALWIIRGFMLADYLGLSKYLQYGVFGINYNSQLSSDTVQQIYNNFATSGYLDGPAGAANRNKQQAFYYSTAFQQAMVGYHYSHPVIVKGVVLTNETVAKTVDPELWVLSYKPIDASKKPMLIAWLGNDRLDRSVPTDIVVGGTELNIDTVSFTGLESSHLEVGTAAIVASVADGAGKKINVAITATPKIIFSNRVNTPKLIDPSEIAIQAVTTTQIKLAWRDENIGLNNTTIYRSLDPATGFTQIYSNYIDNGSFIDTGLSEGVVYYYRVQFEKDGNTSGLSTSYGIQTPRTIAVPGSFNHTAQTPFSITMGWTYATIDAADITGFELWRSDSVAGIYSRIADLPSSARTYTDNGLVANSTYYYKLRAYRALTKGTYTTTINTTTDPVTILPPSLLTAETSYSGDRITLKFDLPISDPSGLGGFFTVVENPGTTNNYINVASVSANPNDATKIWLYLQSAMASATNSIALAYDGANGTLQSIYNVKVGTITNRTVTNRLNDAALFVKRMKINLTTDAYASGLADWNGYSLTGRAYNATQLVRDIAAENGAATGYKFVMVESNPASHLSNIIDITTNFGSYMHVSDPVNAKFPLEVRKITAVVNSTPQDKLIFALMKVDATKLYKVTLYSWLYDGANGAMNVKANGAGVGKNFNSAGNISQTVQLTNIVPALITLPAVSGNAAADGYQSPMVSINITNTSTDRATATAIIIEEVLNN